MRHFFCFYCDHFSGPEVVAMRLTGRDFALHVAQRARARERTCHIRVLARGSDQAAGTWAPSHPCPGPRQQAPGRSGLVSRLLHQRQPRAGTGRPSTVASCTSSLARLLGARAPMRSFMKLHEVSLKFHGKFQVLKLPSPTVPRSD